MNMRIIAFAVAGGLMLSAGAFQRPNKANCDFRAAFSRSIDWDGTLQFGTSGTYDANLGGLRTGYYTLSSDLVTGRIVIDNGIQTTVFDLGEGRTMTLIGQGPNSPALGATGEGSGGTVQLKSGTILLPATYTGVTTYPYLGLPRASQSTDSWGHDQMFIVGGGSTTALLDLGGVNLRWGTNNWLIVTNNGYVAVKGKGTLLADSGGHATATRNGIRVTDGGVYSNSQAGVVLPFELFGVAGSTGNVFEVTNGGRLEGWERFDLKASAGNVLAFRGAATHQTFNVTNATSTCAVRGTGTRLEVTDGATLDILSGSTKRGRIWLGLSENECSNVLYVAGAGSRFTCAATDGCLVGQAKSEGNRVEVSNGAEVVMPNTHIGQGGTPANPAKGNVVRVTTGGTFTDSQTLQVGFGAENPATNGQACSNRLEVASGGIVNAGTLQVGQATNSWGNVVDVADGTVNVTYNFIFGKWGHDNRMRVHDGGKVTVGGTFKWGLNESGFASNNVMEVTSGGEVLAKEFIVYGTNHTLVVSNGAVRTTNAKANGIQLPWYNNVRDWDFTLEVAGTNPVLRAEGTPSSAYVFAIRRGAKVLFRVPREGYVEAPLQAPNGLLGIFDDAKGNIPDIRFDVSACGMHPVRCVIAEGNPLQINTAVMDLMRANLPENCKLKFADNKLTLTVNEFGTSIIFR
ncbi:MAG: hypothetical protein IJI36_07245 [Kiritimatiellae bacterium]|nr:hypothetical protein [Kiritimatiellia bacterium]